MNKAFEYHFEWDPTKAKLNLKKHGLTFERATAIFNDSNALSVFDEQHSSLEERWVTLGMDRFGILIVVCHTYHPEDEHDARIRIISARKATKKENNQYNQI